MVTADMEHKEKMSVECAVSRLRHSSPVRSCAVLALNRDSLDTLQPLIVALNSPFGGRWREAQIAAWTLGRAVLTPLQRQEASIALSNLLQKPVPSTDLRRLRATGYMALFVAVGAFVLALVVAIVEAQTNGKSPIEILFGILIYFPLMFILFILPALPIPFLIDLVLSERRKQVRASAAKALGRLRQPESVLPLANALMDPALMVREVALHAVVPLLTPEHRGQLPSQAVPALCKDLSDFHPQERVLERLDMLEIVGDGRAVFALSQLAARGERPQVKERAAQVLAVIKERQAQDNAPKYLLRASDAGQSSETLLRAASSDTLVEPAQLLRASDTVSGGKNE